MTDVLYANRLHLTMRPRDCLPLDVCSRDMWRGPARHLGLPLRAWAAAA